ncbi:hypothetical protein [Shewanella pealeana]|uniref:Uncharacterized protein n=1 Tax=Shewanella pealeana (strain ATCC 700345 / ANG-SQ1) TaxID=398579 RepID=A8H8A0_SHEPA|nr:hypothetical protein [Shewanella pealeana]ABV88787.1 hypothetical protein Spea_3474 [Shewanella pealeana ATCC 700345]
MQKNNFDYDKAIKNITYFEILVGISLAIDIVFKFYGASKGILSCGAEPSLTWLTFAALGRLIGHSAKSILQALKSNSENNREQN